MLMYNVMGDLPLQLLSMGNPSKGYNTVHDKWLRVNVKSIINLPFIKG